MLASEGFDFEYVTHVVHDRTGTRLYFCYDHGYQYVGKGLIELLYREDGTWVV